MPKDYARTKKGYLRHRSDGERLRMEHDLVWEEYFGKIPTGMQVHHIDGDKTNNDISNLQLVTPLEHKRLHEGCRLENGIWLKPCKVCGEYKPATSNNWYFSRGWINGRICKACYIKKQVDAKRARKQQRKERECDSPAEETAQIRIQL